MPNEPKKLTFSSFASIPVHLVMFYHVYGPSQCVRIKSLLHYVFWLYSSLQSNRLLLWWLLLVGKTDQHMFMKFVSWPPPPPPLPIGNIRCAVFPITGHTVGLALSPTIQVYMYTHSTYREHIYVYVWKKKTGQWTMQ